MRMLLWLREWRPVKENDVPRATQPGPQFWVPEALCTDVQPTQHLSCFLGIAGSVTRHSSQLQGTHSVCPEPPAHGAGSVRASSCLLKQEEQMAICPWELSPDLQCHIPIL